MPFTLSTSLSIAKPSTADSAQFQAAAETTIIFFLGLSSYVVGPLRVKPTALASAIPDTISATLSALGTAPSSTSTTNLTLQPLTTPPVTSAVPTPNPNSNANHNDRNLAFGIAVPLGSIVSFVFGVFLWRNYRSFSRPYQVGPKAFLKRKVQLEKSSRAAAMSQDPQDQDGAMAFLQRKAELEAERIRRHELDAENVRHELETKESMPELHGGATRQELKGEEFSQELRGEEFSQEFEAYT